MIGPELLLQGAIAYAAAAVDGVGTPLLRGPTPCAEWNLAQLLWHLGDSIQAVHEGLATGRIGPAPAFGPGTDPAGGTACRAAYRGANPVRAFHDRAGALAACAALLDD